MDKSASSPIGALPRQFTCRGGTRLSLLRLTAAAETQLQAMYLAYQPRNSFQGLPPIKDEVCARWVHDMLGEGFHVAACDGEDAVVGHAALFPLSAHKCELLVAVLPAFQNVGLGTELVHTCVDWAAGHDFTQIWLPVTATNVRARHVYEKCGFTYVNGALSSEVDMTCDTLHCRRPARETPAGDAPHFLTGPVRPRSGDRSGTVGERS